MSCINKIENVDIKIFEYFGFGQCLRSWVQPLTFNFCLLHAHQEESRKIQEVPKGKETIVTNFK
jgi:hypothetical protein